MYLGRRDVLLYDADALLFVYLKELSDCPYLTPHRLLPLRGLHWAPEPHQIVDLSWHWPLA